MVESLALPLSDYTQQLRGEIDAALDSYSNWGAECPPRLREAIRYSLLAPGKRLRPLLVLMSSEACGSDRQPAMPAACAVEMVHSYSLIHDDLPAMDDDDLRRGQPTCHKRFGEATAILAGDALLTRAFEVLSRDIQPGSLAACCCAELAAAAGAAGMVGGQEDDLAAERAEVADLTALQAIHRRKTGAMFRVSLRLGALVAAANQEQLAALDTFGQKLGLAFQITDDLLDVQGDEAQVGKRTGKDSGRGKLTFPELLGVAESRRQAAALIAEACQAVQPLGTGASQLEALARFVEERNR